MKRTIVALLVVLMAGSAFSQGDLENQFYFRFGLVKPTKAYFGLNEDDGWDFIDKAIGGEFELGSIFMLNSIPLADGMRLGINVDYASLTYTSMKAEDGDVIIGTFMFGSKVGPSFSYSPVDKLVFDAFVKINPIWVGATAIVFDESYDMDDEGYGGLFGIKYSIGLNVRYSVLMLTFEANPGKMMMTNVDDEDIELGNWSDDGKTTFNTINFKLGFSF